eukprot:TRINITY_DN181_c0_g1_i1.p1 TRINITY_DN181_c0_g1~~TRINITY_DN181_c0_g1_i1.p1  ORF type:complete len:141 (+),score=16.34 TRINITY_DN181_c0_g1_i1:139-561(+)
MGDIGLSILTYWVYNPVFNFVGDYFPGFYVKDDEKTLHKIDKLVATGLDTVSSRLGAKYGTLKWEVVRESVRRGEYPPTLIRRSHANVLFGLIGILVGTFLMKNKNLQSIGRICCTGFLVLNVLPGFIIEVQTFGKEKRY